MKHAMIPLFLMMCMTSTPSLACSTTEDDPTGCDGYDQMMSTIYAGVLAGAVSSLGGLTAFLYTGAQAKPYGEQVLNQYMHDNPVAVQGAIMTGAGPAVHDLALILGEPDASRLGRRMRARRASLLPLVTAKEFDAARFRAQLVN